MSGPFIILGPQHPHVNVGEVLDAHGVTGHVALINAGQRWDEAPVDDLALKIDRPVHHLPLYHWFEQVMKHNPDLSAGYSERQSKIKAYKKLYRVRLHAALGTVAELRQTDGVPDDLIAEALTQALFDVRKIDDDLVRSLSRIRDQYPVLAKPWDIPDCRRRHNEAAAVLRGCEAVVIAGGHVAVLRNRLYFFGFEKLLTEFRETGKPLVCWSAGAMALSSRIVLFYDDPPEGTGEAEILDVGPGLIDDLVVFPHARRRLRLEQTDRVARLAMRFAPAKCVGLESGAWLERENNHWVSKGDVESARQFGEDGNVTPFGGAA